MRHPFDGIQGANEKPALHTRRSMLGRMLGVTAGVVGIQAAACAQKVATTQAVGEEGAVASTRALGEEGGVTKALREAGMTQARIPSETGVARPAPQSVDLSDKQMEEAWAKLGEADAAKATIASNTLYSAKKVVPFLKEKLKVDAAAVDEKQVGQLIQDLDADDFATREKASTTLAKMGPEVVPVIQSAMPKASSLEVKRRLEMVLMKLRESEKLLQVQRGLQILVDIPSKEAHDVVEGISKQTPETWLTQEAKTALKPVPPPAPINLPPVRIEIQPKR
jgi:hypothetical protein